MSVSRRWTVADLEQIEPKEGERYEIIGGELFVSKQPSWEHQNVCLRLGGFLEAWNDDSGRGSTSIAPGLIFSVEDAAAPDIAWISWANLQAGRDRAGHVTLAPELLIEILSPGWANERRDREIKLALYAREGVEEYWIVDWQDRTVDIFRRVGQTLVLAQTLAGDVALESPLLPGFSVPLARIWPRRPPSDAGKSRLDS